MFALFIIFALLLGHLFTIVQKTSEIKESDLQIPVKEPDYEKADENDIKFNLPKLFADKNEWKKSTARSAESGNDYTDLMEAFQISRCGHCEYLIPRSILKNGGKCLFCRKSLVKPGDEDSSEVVAARLDSDEDGIPNIVEIEKGLNPYDAHDSLFDLDKDGFSNVYEHQMATDMADAKSHPQLCNGLYIASIETQPLKAELLGVSVVEGRDKTSWDIQIRTDEQVIMRNRKKIKRKEEKHYLAIDSEIYLESGKYTIVDIISAEVEKMVDKKMQKVMEHSVVLRDSKNRTLTIRVGEKANALDDKAVLKDVWGISEYQGKVGERIRMGNKNIGYTYYTIKAISKKNNTVVLESPVKDGKDIVIKTEAIMPKELIPEKEEKTDNGLPGEGPLPGDPAMPIPVQRRY